MDYLNLAENGYDVGHLFRNIDCENFGVSSNHVVFVEECQSQSQLHYLQTLKECQSP